MAGPAQIVTKQRTRKNSNFDHDSREPEKYGEPENDKVGVFGIEKKGENIYWNHLSEDENDQNFYKSILSFYKENCTKRMLEVNETQLKNRHPEKVYTKMEDWMEKHLPQMGFVQIGDMNNYIEDEEINIQMYEDIRKTYTDLVESCGGIVLTESLHFDEYSAPHYQNNHIFLDDRGEPNRNYQLKKAYEKGIIELPGHYMREKYTKLGYDVDDENDLKKLKNKYHLKQWEITMLKEPDKITRRNNYAKGFNYKLWDEMAKTVEPYSEYFKGGIKLEQELDRRKKANELSIKGFEKKKLYETLTLEIEQLQEEHDSLDSALEPKRKEKKELQAKIDSLKELEKDVKSNEATRDEIDSIIRLSMEQKKRLEEENEAKQQHLSRLKGDSRDIYEKNKSLDLEINNIENQIKTSKNELKHKESVKDLTIQDLKGLHDRIEEFEQFESSAGLPETLKKVELSRDFFYNKETRSKYSPKQVEVMRKLVKTNDELVNFFEKIKSSGKEVDFGTHLGEYQDIYKKVNNLTKPKKNTPKKPKNYSTPLNFEDNSVSKDIDLEF